ncbi:hypothetical protein [Lactiplantibacillus pentosus]|uniref:hypothetical protein n=1 Tax=Lactiplantibacillus pentosus TaxID=1589 RepID=UPI001CDB20E9|nr:hypothetical protein [Lactiplantibacillus pentosus]
MLKAILERRHRVRGETFSIITTAWSAYSTDEVELYGPKMTGSLNYKTLNHGAFVRFFFEIGI